MKKNCLVCHAKLLLFKALPCMAGWPERSSCPYSQLFDSWSILPGAGTGATLDWMDSGYMGSDGTCPVESFQFTTGPDPQQGAGLVVFRNCVKDHEIYKTAVYDKDKQCDKDIESLDLFTEGDDVTLVAQIGTLLPNMQYTVYFKVPDSSWNKEKK